MSADRPEPDPDPAEEPVTFTADELGEMEAGGLTLADAIRAIEARPG